MPYIVLAMINSSGIWTYSGVSHAFHMFWSKQASRCLLHFREARITRLCLKRCLYYDLQKHLGDIAGQASIEDVMRMLAASHKQEETHLWTVCSNLVGKSGLSRENLSKHLPGEVVSMIEQIRRKTGFGYGGSLSTGAITENRTNRMQKALDSSDVELVKLMVMGEGLDLDIALGLHYAVEKCSM